MLTLEEINNLVLSYASDLQYEGSAIEELSKARDAYETEKARVLVSAYNAGVIDGKNETARKLQETEVLENSASVDFLCAYMKDIENRLAEYTTDRKVTEAKISLYKAWLYSLSGKP